jgi:large subunit ribosomal protein L25
LLVDLSVESDARAKRLALVQEIQHHPLDGNVLHVDFHEVTENEKVVVMVPLETAGEAAGVKNSGGVLEHIVFKLKVRALPKDLPEQIVVDVSHLELCKAIHLGEIKTPDGVEILGDKNIAVISVAMPRTEEEEAAVAAEGEAVSAGDVEMIKEKKEGDEEGAAPAKGEKGAVKAGEKGAVKPGEKVPAKGVEKGAAAAPEKAADKKAAKPVEKKK